MRGTVIALARGIGAAILAALAVVAPVAADGPTDQADEIGPIDARAARLSSFFAAVAPGDLTPNQLTGSRTLTRDEALAACGPAAAAALARSNGLDVSLDAAVATARTVGWTAASGMAGPVSQVALLKRLGVSAVLQPGLDREKLLRDVTAGRPVIIRTPGAGGHYLVAERYDRQSGRLDFGQSALVLRRSAGRRWYSLDELPSLGIGAPTHSIYLASPSGRQTAATAQPANGSAGTVRWRTTSTGGANARLRAEPSTGAPIVGRVPDGGRVADRGVETTAEGRVWRRVTNPSGGLAWIAAELLLPSATSE